MVLDRGPLFPAVGAEYPIPCRTCAAADPAGCPGGVGCLGRVVVGWDLADRRVFARVDRDGTVHTGWWRQLDRTAWAQPAPERAQTRRLVAWLAARARAYADLPGPLADLLAEAVGMPWAAAERAGVAAPTAGAQTTEVAHVQRNGIGGTSELACKLTAIDEQLDRLRAAAVHTGEVIARSLGDPAVIGSASTSRHLTDAAVLVAGLPVALLELRRLVEAAREHLDVPAPTWSRRASRA